MDKFLQKFTRNKIVFYTARLIFWFIVIVYVGLLPLAVIVTPKEIAETIAGASTFGPIFIIFAALYEFPPVGLLLALIVLIIILLTILYMLYGIYKIREKFALKNDAMGISAYFIIAAAIIGTSLVFIFSHVPPIDL